MCLKKPDWEAADTGRLCSEDPFGMEIGDAIALDAGAKGKDEKSGAGGIKLPAPQFNKG